MLSSHSNPIEAGDPKRCPATKVIMMSETLAIQVMEALARRDAYYIKSIASESAIISGGIFTASVPLADAMGVMRALWAAVPDFQIEINAVETRAETIAVSFMWGGTHTGTLNLPGRAPVPATGKSVWVPDIFVFRFVAEKIAALQVESVDGSGIPGMLVQIGAAPTRA